MHEQTTTAMRLVAQIPEILRRWETSVRSEVPAARDQQPLILQNNLGPMLTEVALSLSPDPAIEQLLGGLTFSQDHGGLRALQEEYSLAAVLLEYNLLRQSIFEVLEEAGALPPEEREVIAAALERSMRDAASQFALVHQRAERKRGDNARAAAAMLTDADQHKNEFLAMLAHELRTPLSAISNAHHLLEESDLDERSARHVAIASRQARQVSRLVEDLMDLARIGRGTLELRLEPVDLCRVAQDAANAVGPAVEARKQRLSCAIPPKPVPVTGDPVRLGQVIANLLHNAMRYTPEGGHLCLEVREGDEATVRVTDDGAGIAPDMLPRVFEMFVQGEPGECSSPGGLGVGLALVRSLVDLHGGTVTAQSAGPGQGAEFVVRLPPPADPPVTGTGKPGVGNGGAR